jgi:DNA-binding NarL/FixJ family response regulator
MMPNLGGDMFYRAVGRVKPHLCQRFIFITGLNEDPRVDALLRKVRARVLYKPFDPDAMLEAIQQLEKRAGAVAVGMV